MTKQILLTVVLFAVALTSGVFIGMNMQRHSDRAPQERSWLADELKLNPAQREQMRSIWQEIAPGPGRRHDDKRRDAARERDEAIAALFTPQQKPAYDRIMDHYNQQMADISKEREATVQKAVERTKAILDPQQKDKFEQILAKGPFPFGPPRKGPTTAPSTRRLEQPER